MLGQIRYALLCLMLCGICDMFDGTLAKRATRNSRQVNFGVQIDSLADLTCFGIQPAVIGYFIFGDYLKDVLGLAGTILTIVVMCAYILAALIRLAYYNVIEAELQKEHAKRVHYDGLPVTTSALILPVIYSAYTWFKIPFPPTYAIAMVAVSAAFLMKFQIPKIKPRYLVVFLAVGLPFVIYLFFSTGG